MSDFGCELIAHHIQRTLTESVAIDPQGSMNISYPCPQAFMADLDERESSRTDSVENNLTWDTRQGQAGTIRLKALN